MDDLCQKMEVMIAKFNEVVGNLDGLRGVTNQSAPQQVDSQEIFIQPDLEIIDFSTVPQDNEHAMEMDDVEDETESEDQSVAVQDHVMTTDSYGKLRYFLNLQIYTKKVLILCQIRGRHWNNGHGRSPEESWQPRLSFKWPIDTRGNKTTREEYQHCRIAVFRARAYLANDSVSTKIGTASASSTLRF